MNQAVKDYIIEKVNALINAPTCCGELKASAQNWLDALGTDKEAEQTKSLLADLERDIVTVVGLIAFAESEAGINVFGREQAPKVAAHAREIKADGAQYCDCPACAAAAAILEKKDEIL